MITKITGQVQTVHDDSLTIAIDAFEYRAYIPEFVRRQLQNRLGETVSLHTIQYMEGNPAQGRLTPRLVGFLSEVEREFFELFCSVDGVGFRKALRAMVRPVAEVAASIEEQDVKALAALPGIGPATAERIIAKLRRKVPKFALLVAQEMAQDAAAAPRHRRRDVRDSAGVGAFRGGFAPPAGGGLADVGQVPGCRILDSGNLRTKPQTDRHKVLTRTEQRGRPAPSLPKQGGHLRAPTGDEFRCKGRQLMSREPILGAQPPANDDAERDLRPQRMHEMVGQREVYERLQIAVDAATKRQEALGHMLFDGPPGLGKTTFALCLPREMQVHVQLTSGATLQAPKDLIPYLTNADERSVLFIDEIHRLPKAVEEYLYTAMEDFRIDIVHGEGTNARTLEPVAQAVHADRRHHLRRLAVGTAARPVPDSRTPGFL